MAGLLKYLLHLSHSASQTEKCRTGVISCAAVVRWYSACVGLFRSTPLTRRITEFLVPKLLLLGISIHSSYEENHIRQGLLVDFGLISIHSSYEENHKCFRCSIGRAPYFNPLLLRGESQQTSTNEMLLWCNICCKTNKSGDVPPWNWCSTHAFQCPSCLITYRVFQHSFRLSNS